MENKIELLAPAGDLERLKVACDYGADAVFIGGKRFSLRSRASNFDLATIQEAVNYAHRFNKRVHVTVNMILHDDDFDGLTEYLQALEQIGVDAIIVASFEVLRLAKQVAKNLEVHISTQYSITNSETIKMYQKLGADRVVLAREVNLNQLSQMIENSPLPIETFLHGGMCVNYSGRCTLSNYMTLRDANRGGCAQSCRWKYRLYDDENRLISDEKVLFSMSSKDLTGALTLAELIRLKVSSLKIEGRMKTDFYIATVVGAYRKAIDAIYAQKLSEKTILATLQQELSHAENRETFSGFYLNKPDALGHLYGVNGANVNQNYVAKVLDYNPITQQATLQIRNHFSQNDALQIMRPYFLSDPFYPKNMINSDLAEVERFYKPMEIVSMQVPFAVMANDYVRKVDWS